MGGWLTTGELESLVVDAGFADQPVSLAACGPDGEVVTQAQGTWQGGTAVSAGDLF